MATQEQRDMLTNLLEPILKECGIESFKVRIIDPKYYYEIYLNTNSYESQFHPAVLKPRLYFNARPKEARTPSSLLLEGDEVFPRESVSNTAAQTGEKKIITFDEYLQGLQDAGSNKGFITHIRNRITKALQNYETQQKEDAKKAELYGSQRYVV